MNLGKSSPVKHGFTIVELLVVIVVIGVLAAITIVSYTGIASRAVATALQSDLTNASRQLKMYYTEYGSYPTTMVSNCPTLPINDSKYCLKTSSNNTYTNYSSNGNVFSLTLTNTNTTSYTVTENISPKLATLDPTNWQTIGSQVWAKTNLNVGTMVTGATTQTNNSVLEKYCYNNTESNCTTYGALYQWDEAMQYATTAGAQGICPTGSHIPTDDEWKTLEKQLGMTQAEADAQNAWRGTDQGTQLRPGGSSGLNAQLAGYRDPDGVFLGPSSYAFMWSSSEYNTQAWARAVYTGLATEYRGYYIKGYAWSVRCLGN